MYSLIVERLERHVLAERQVAAVMRAAGAKATAPTFDGELAKLNQMLDMGPQRQYSDEQAALIAALGLGRG